MANPFYRPFFEKSSPKILLFDMFAPRFFPNHLLFVVSHADFLDCAGVICVSGRSWHLGLWEGIINDFNS